MVNRKTLLEICVASVADAEIAQAAGADRIELNTALQSGGLTPSLGLVKTVLKHVSIPVIAMVRPRPSGFCYSDREFETMCCDVQLLMQAGVAGIAFGVLTDQGDIDVPRSQRIVELVGSDGQTVFHRAFDIVRDQPTALRHLIDCGVSRVMTSGSASRAWDGRAQIRNLQQIIEQQNTTMQILAAGGVRSDHVVSLIEETGISQIHAGLGQWLTDASYQTSEQVNFYSTAPQDPAVYRESCAQLIREMVQILP